MNLPKNSLVLLSVFFIPLIVIKVNKSLGLPCGHITLNLSTSNPSGVPIVIDNRYKKIDMKY